MYDIAHMLKEFFFRNLLARQMKDVPKEYQERIMRAISENPDFFTKMAGEVDENMKKGMGQLQAVQKAVLAYQDELRKMLEA